MTQATAVPHGGRMASAHPSWLTVAPVFPLMLIALALLASTAFTFLQTDDFCTFGRVVQRFGGNPFRDIHTLYVEWTGRYSASMLVSMVAASTMLAPVAWVYPAALALFLLLFGLACWAVSRPSEGDGRQGLLLAMLLFTTTLLLMPSKLEQFLWLTGAAVYFVGGSVLMLLVAALAREPGSTSRAGHWKGELIVLAAIGSIAGFNEFLALTVGACVGYSSLSEFRRTRRLSRQQAVRMAVFAAALAATVMAPGNFARDANSIVPRHDAWIASSLTLQNMFQFGDAMARQHLAAIAASLLGCIAAGASTGVGRPSSLRALAPYAIIFVAAFPLHFWTYSFLTGEATPGRIINQAFMLAHIGICLLAAACGAWLAERKPILQRHAWLMILLSGAVLLVGDEFRSFQQTLRMFAPVWRAEQMARHEGLAAISGTRQTVYLKPFAYGDSNPPVFRGTDVASDPQNWINRCVADYYEVQSVLPLRRLP